jgi:hypothetical protein
VREGDSTVGREIERGGMAVARSGGPCTGSPQDARVAAGHDGRHEVRRDGGGKEGGATLSPCNPGLSWFLPVFETSPFATVLDGLVWFRKLRPGLICRAGAVWLDGVIGFAPSEILSAQRETDVTDGVVGGDRAG